MRQMTRMNVRSVAKMWNSRPAWNLNPASKGGINDRSTEAP